MFGELLKFSTDRLASHLMQLSFFLAIGILKPDYTGESLLRGRSK